MYICIVNNELVFLNLILCYRIDYSFCTYIELNSTLNVYFHMISDHMENKYKYPFSSNVVCKDSILFSDEKFNNI